MDVTELENQPSSNEVIKLRARVDDNEQSNRN